MCWRGRGASAKSACRPVSYFQHFDMYFPLVVYFFTQRSLFAKKDYSNTKQRAGQGATKEKSRGGAKGRCGKGHGVFQEPKRLDGRRYNIWFISLALSLNFFLPILYVLHMPIWKHGALNHPLLEKQPPPETSCVCPTLFYLGFFFVFGFCVIHPHNFHVSVVVVCICIGTATIKHLLMCRVEENAPNSNMCACVCALPKPKENGSFPSDMCGVCVCVYLVGGNFPFSFSGWKAF